MILPIWKVLIQETQTAIDVPLIVKEVGFGMTRETLDHLAALGVHTVDISGRSGTSFTQSKTPVAPSGN